MSEYFGTDGQKQLQARVVESAGWIAATPGACNAGRFLGCDDIERLGWNRIAAILRRDGVFGFRMVPSDRVDDLTRHLADLGFRIDFWDLFVGDRVNALPAAEAIVARGLPEPFTDMVISAPPDDGLIDELQSLMAANGLVPFPAAMLTDRLGSTVLVAVRDPEGAPAAVAYSYLPHNDYSSYSRHAFGGLVAVAPTYRGRGLGRYINARMVASAFRRLDATFVYEIVHASNLVSRRMVEACGLYLHPALKCGIAVAAGSERFTT